MWMCKSCSHETKRRFNLIRHTKLVHNIIDRDGRNAIRKSKNSVELYRKNWMNTSDFSNDHEPQSKMSNDERLMSEERCHGKRHHDEKRHKNHGIYEQQSMMESESLEESSENEPGTNPDIRQYTTEQIERFGAELTAKKCHILNCVMKTIPEHLKVKTKLICYALKCRDHFFIKSNYEIMDGGSTIQGSKVYAVIIDLLTRRGETKDVGTQTNQRFEQF